MRELVKTLFEDESAVSPVIGVILMVAITVILAAVIGTMVMDMTEGVGEVAPTASMSATDASQNYKPAVTASGTGTQNLAAISHDAGNSIPASDIRIVIRKASSNAKLATWEGGSWTKTISPADSGDTIAFGLVLNGDATAFGSSNYESTSITASDKVDITATLTDGGTNGVDMSGSLPDETRYIVQIQHIPSQSSVLDTELAIV